MSKDIKIALANLQIIEKLTREVLANTHDVTATRARALAMIRRASEIEATLERALMTPGSEGEGKGQGEGAPALKPDRAERLRYIRRNFESHHDATSEAIVDIVDALLGE